MLNENRKRTGLKFGYPDGYYRFQYPPLYSIPSSATAALDLEIEKNMPKSKGENKQGIPDLIKNPKGMISFPESSFKSWLNEQEIYLNENTVTQELKRYSRQKEYDEDFIEKSIKKVFLMIKHGVADVFNIENLRILAKWVVYNAIKKEKNDDYIYPNHGNWNVPTTPGNSRLESLYILGAHFLSGNTDYLTANVDQNGNLNPQLASKFNNINFTSDDLVDLSAAYHEDLKKGKRNIQGALGREILSFPDGYKWVDLEKGYCSVEAKSMGHCGNVGRKAGDTILSLRDSKNVPHLTFILNNGVLGEMKGRNNDKPQPKYHPYIIELLKLPLIKNVKGGGYKPENNFSLTDLNKDQTDELLKIKPELENSLIMDKFTKGLNSMRSVSQIVSDYTPEINDLIKKTKEPELKVLFKYLKYVRSKTGKTIESGKTIDDFFDKDELLMLLNNKTIKFIEENYISEMGERLEIEKIIIETKNEIIHKAIVEEYKSYRKVLPPTHSGLFTPLYWLCLNENTSEDVQKEILKIIEQLKETDRLNWFRPLAYTSKHPLVLKKIFYEVEKIKEDLHGDDVMSNLGKVVNYVLDNLFQNKNTPNEIRTIMSRSKVYVDIPG